MEDINKKANEDELNKAHEEIGKTPRKFIPVPKSKNQNEDGEQESNPQNLEKGMRVKAICMGKLVGDYIVDRVDAGKAYLLVRGDESKKTSKVVSSSINSHNGAVECLEGNTIQCAEYYYES